MGTLFESELLWWAANIFVIFILFDEYVACTLLGVYDDCVMDSKYEKERSKFVTFPWLCSLQREDNQADSRHLVTLFDVSLVVEILLSHHPCVLYIKFFWIPPLLNLESKSLEFSTNCFTSFIPIFLWPTMSF